MSQGQFCPKGGICLILVVSKKSSGGGGGGGGQNRIQQQTSCQLLDFGGVHIKVFILGFA